MVKVSVVVPIYNAELYLKQCLDSIVNQTLKEIEIILIDDGSTDGSAEICKQYLTDSRVTYQYKENEGLAAARADGLARAKGEYIGFVDSDDWLELNTYEEMYAASRINNADIVFCNCIENEDGHRFSPEMRNGAFNRDEIKAEILPKTLAYVSKNGGKRSIRWSNCLRIYRMAHLRENAVKFDRRLRRSQDLQFTYDATLCAQNYYYLGDKHFYHNRVVGNSLSRGYTKNMWNLYKMLIERLYASTEAFKEMDLMDQMHLRSFFCVLDSIENELKPACPNDKTLKVKLIEEIIYDDICKKFYNHIPVEDLNSLYQEYYNLIVTKDAKGILAAAEKYEKKMQFEHNVVRPLKHFITEGPIIGAIYKRIIKNEKWRS